MVKFRSSFSRRENVPAINAAVTDQIVVLRQWQDSDLAPFAAMNADSDVMKFFPRLLTFEESCAALGRFRSGIDERGWGLWAVEVEGKFAGLTGLSEPKFTAHFTPCVEIGWRFRKEYWGRSIAFSAARQAEDYARFTLGLEELVSFTASINWKSRGLMERLGFQYDSLGDFLHPNVPEGHPLQLHALYRKRYASRAGPVGPRENPGSSIP